MSNQIAFQDRLGRINARGANTNGHIIAGIGTSSGPVKPALLKRAGRPGLLKHISFPIMLLWATLVGMLAVFASRYVRFQMFGGTLSGGENADMAMMVDAFAAMVAAFVLRQMFRVQGNSYNLAQTLGVLAMIVGMHNLVFVAPQAFSVVFSQAWVQDVMAKTEPNSILFRGATLVVDKDTTSADLALLIGS